MMSVEEKRAKGREYYRKYMARPGNRERTKKAMRENYAKNREQRRQYSKNWRDTHHKINRDSFKKWESVNEIKYRAKLAAQRLVPLKPVCEICGDNGAIGGKLGRHHKDYGKPLEVLTLCKVCHEALEVVEPPICSKQPEIRYYKGLEAVEVLAMPRIKRGEHWPCKFLRTGEVRDVCVTHLLYLPHPIRFKRKSSIRSQNKSSEENKQ